MTELNELQRLFFHDQPSKRAKWFDILSDPIWTPRYNYPLEGQRELAINQLKCVAKSGIVSVTDFLNNNAVNIFTAHENIGMVSPGTATKFTVHYNLFGGTITALHTERHKYLFPEIDRLDITGCFCLTELGYGNNAVEMETTVTYDTKTKEFVVNSPTTLSQKYWITNGAVHANYAVVFGQTIVNGKNEGVNAFLVPIRDKKLNKLPGVQIDDMGVKIGLNGVDNAILKFNNVRIPRVNMLNRYSDVDENGAFKSDVKGIQQRFFKVTERLLSGRLCIASMTIGANKASAYIAIKYAQKRMGVSPNGKSQTPIFQYQLQQNALVPLVSKLVALNMLHNYAKTVFMNSKGLEHELLSICCIDKTMIGWHGERSATIFRERCGGQGFLSANRFGQAIAGAHAALTAEGDNRVLMVKIVKDMITNVTKGLSKLPQYSANAVTKSEDILDLKVLLNLFRRREATLFEDLLAKMGDLKSKGLTAYQILMFNTSDEIQDLATAYGERLAMEQSVAALETIKCPHNREILATHFRIFGLETVLNYLPFFLFKEAVSIDASKGFRDLFREEIKKAASKIDKIIDNLNVPVHALHTPIAADYVKYNEKPYYGQVVGARM